MSNEHDHRPFDILLVDDSPTDILLTRDAFEHSKIGNMLHVVEDGIDAVAFLQRTAPHEDAPRPGLILLDLNLPKMSGLEVLEIIKQDKILRTIPVVVITTSKAEEDVIRSYGLHANCYIKKPLDFGKLADVVKAINEFWFTVVTLPPTE